MGEACEQRVCSEGWGVDAVLFSVESTTTGVTAFAGPSAEGEDGIIRLFNVICSMLRRQVATISSPRIVPKVSTFWNSGGREFEGDLGRHEGDSEGCVDDGIAPPRIGSKG